MAAVRHLGFVKLKFFNGQISKSNIIEIIEIGQTIAEIDFCDSSRWLPPPSWIFKNSKF